MSIYTDFFPNGLQNNFIAVVAPTATDDFSIGYVVGSHWVDTLADTAYICVDSTNGAAVWMSVSTPPAPVVPVYPPTPTIFSTAGVFSYTVPVNVNTLNVLIAPASSTGGNNGAGFTPASNDYGHQAAGGAITVFTMPATAGEIISVTVGAAGAPPVVGSMTATGNGNQGGLTTIAGICTASAGTGGSRPVNPYVAPPATTAGVFTDLGGRVLTITASYPGLVPVVTASRLFTVNVGISDALPTGLTTAAQQRTITVNPYFTEGYTDATWSLYPNPTPAVGGVGRGGGPTTAAQVVQAQSDGYIKFF